MEFLDWDLYLTMDFPGQGAIFNHGGPGLRSIFNNGVSGVGSIFKHVPVYKC